MAKSSESPSDGAKRARTTAHGRITGPIAEPEVLGAEAIPLAEPSVLAVESVPIDRVKRYRGNPRRNESAIALVVQSITEFGWRQPIVVDADFVIIAGDTRYLAARQMGVTRVPVHIARNLTPSQVRAYRLADNRTGQEAAWDPDALKRELEALSAEGFDLGLTGFQDAELETLLGIPSGLKPGEDPDEAPALPTMPTSKPGELYQLGMHRLLCGDATRSNDWGRLMGDDRADLIFTDPPYDVDYQGGGKAKLKIQNDALGYEGTLKLLRASLSLALGHARDGAALYVCAPHGPQFYPFAKVGTELGWWRQTVLWVKDGFALGRSDYHYRHEAILEGLKIPVLEQDEPAKEVDVLGYGWKPGARHAWAGDRKQDSAWEFPKPRRSSEHPTMKPVALIEKAIRNSTGLGATVVDCFAGSGSSIIASEGTGRRCLAIELDPHYVDVILQRFERATGTRPSRIEDTP